MELNHLASEYTNAERRPQSISLREYSLLHPYSTAEKSQCAQSFVPVLMRKKRRCEQVQRNPRLNFLRSQKKGASSLRARCPVTSAPFPTTEGMEGSAVSPQCFQFPAQLRRGSFPASSRRRPSLGAPFIQTPSLHAPGSVKEMRGSG